MITKEFLPSSADLGKTVGYFLKMHGVSHHCLVQLKKQPDGITQQGILRFTTHRLDSLAPVQVCLAETAVSDLVPNPDLPLDIVHEDADFFVLNKPAGMAVHPSTQNYDNTLGNALAHLYVVRSVPFVYRPIGRLDKNTSGLLVVAKHLLCASILTQMQVDKRMQRTYLAICTGNLPDSGTIHAPIGRKDGSALMREVRADGDIATTHYTCLQRAEGISLAQIRLETGRTHQIRVHMAHVGHGLLGDFLYHPDCSRIDRHALHAHRLTFAHPFTNKPLAFTAPLPADMANALHTRRDAHWASV